MLELRHISKCYKIDRSHMVSVLKDINLSFKRGEFVSILGESGCGKSTLMNIIGGLDFDYEGDVLIDEQSIKGFKDHARDDYRKKRVGFIFQSFNLIPHLSILENVTIAMQLSNISKEARNKRAKKLLKDMGLEAHLNKKPNQLSGGQKQRVAIARALANDPDIILADEPTGALDSKTSNQILELMGEIARQGKLIITVTHSDKVAAFGTRVIKLEDGQVVEDKYYLKKIRHMQQPSKVLQAKNLSMVAAMKLALNNMKLNAWRNILVALGASIGISSVILMLALGSGMRGYIIDSMNENTNPLVIEVNKEDEDEVHLPGPPGMNVVPFEEEDIVRIRNIEEVVDVEKGTQLMMQSSLIDEERSVDIQMLMTINGSITHKALIAGEYPEGQQMLVSESVVKTLQHTNESILGETFDIAVITKDKDNLPIILEQEFIVSGIYDTENFGPMSDLTLVRMSFEALEEMYEEEGLEIPVTNLYAYASSEEDVDSIRATILEQGYTGSREEAMLEVFIDFLAVATTVLTAMAAISLIVSSIMILVVLYISVIERTKEIGILRAIGGRKQDIRTIFFSEAALIGLFAGIIGILCAKVVDVVGNAILMEQMEMALIDVSGYYMAIGLVLSVGVSILAGVFPASRAAKLDPVESLRYE